MDITLFVDFQTQKVTKEFETNGNTSLDAPCSMDSGGETVRSRFLRIDYLKKNVNI